MTAQDSDSGAQAPSEASQLKAQLEELQQKNQAGMQRLASQGARFDPAGIMMTRLQTLIEVAFPDERQALAFELVFERKIADQLEGADAELARAKLLGPNGSPFQRG